MTEKKKPAPAGSAASDAERVCEALAAPFDPSEVHLKPQSVSGNRALAVPFIDARTVQDRLDDTLGVCGWQDSYEVLPDGSVVCRLKVRIAGEWIVKEDVGSPSDQPDAGDKRKAAFSDALKRCAVKFGVGRYLYRQKPEWMDYDPVKRRFVGNPAAPPPQQRQQQRPDGKTLAQRLEALSAEADRAGVKPPGALVADVLSEFARLGDDYRRWPEGADSYVMPFARQRYVALVGPLPATTEAVLKLTALLKEKGLSWHKISPGQGWPKDMAKLSRAQAADAMAMVGKLVEKATA